MVGTALTYLGHNERARRLAEDTVDRCRRALGPDQPTSLFTAAALTVALARLGEAERARTLSEDTVERCRRVLGPDDPIALPRISWELGKRVRVSDKNAAQTVLYETP